MTAKPNVWTTHKLYLRLLCFIRTESQELSSTLTMSPGQTMEYLMILVHTSLSLQRLKLLPPVSTQQDSCIAGNDFMIELKAQVFLLWNESHSLPAINANSFLTWLLREYLATGSQLLYFFISKSEKVILYIIFQH